jgi:hypothetical protein
MSALPPNRGVAPISAVAETAAEKQSKPGPGFTNVEDMIVARAFISASENPFLGTMHQKGKVFKAHMLKIYNDFIVEQQVEKDKAMLDRSSQSTQEE